MSSFVTILVTILVFSVMILVHELGHFLVARRAGVRVHEFALGFGPRLLARRRGATTYSLRAIPLGGFVRMAGMHPNEEDWEEVPAPERFLGKSLGQRAAIIAAGPAMNVLAAIVLFTLVFGVVGLLAPTVEVARVMPDLPAAAAGLEPGDVIRAVEGQPVEDWNELAGAIRARPGRETTLTLERSGQEVRLQLVPAESEPGVGVIGIEPVMARQRTPLPAAVWEGFLWTGQVITSFFEGLVHLFSGQSGTEVVGPVGIGRHIGEATRSGWTNLLVLAAVLNLNLALINLLPIPALDGSRLVFLAWEGVRGKPVDPDKEGFVHFIGFALLLALSILITYRDILSLA